MAKYKDNSIWRRKQKLNSELTNNLPNFPEKILLSRRDREIIENLDKRRKYHLSFLKIIDLFLSQDIIFKFRDLLILQALDRAKYINTYQNINLKSLNHINRYLCHNVIQFLPENRQESISFLEIFYSYVGFICQAQQKKVKNLDFIEKYVDILKVLLDKKNVRTEQEFRIFSKFYNEIEKNALKVENDKSVFFRVCLILKRTLDSDKADLEVQYPYLSKKNENKKNIISPKIVTSLPHKGDIPLIDIENSGVSVQEFEPSKETIKFEKSSNFTDAPDFKTGIDFGPPQFLLSSSDAAKVTIIDYNESKPFIPIVKNNANFSLFAKNYFNF